jgi:L-lactate utilization protein LutC
VTGPTDAVARFRAAAEAQSCRTHECAPDGVVSLIAERCAALGGLVALARTEPAVATEELAGGLRTAGLEVLRPDDPDWRHRVPAAAIGVTTASVAVAELGVFAVAAGVGVPRAVSLLPETHICVITADSVVETFAAGLARAVEGPRGAARLPSALLWIGGPSRTGDLEMVVTLGVHGPRAVEIVVVGTGTFG